MIRKITIGKGKRVHLAEIWGASSCPPALPYCSVSTSDYREAKGEVTCKTCLRLASPEK